MTLRYAHLSPTHLRSAMARTARPAMPAAPVDEAAQRITQEITQEPRGGSGVVVL
jgi:hypothetical protein